MFRFHRKRRCPICQGCPLDPRGAGLRCFGFLSDDGRYAHCTREEYAGLLYRNARSNAFPHRLDGRCSCGLGHRS